MDSASSHIWFLVEEVLSHPADQQEDAVRRLCGADEALAAEVRARLRLVENDRSFFEATTRKPAPEDPANAETLRGHPNAASDNRSPLPGLFDPLDPDVVLHAEHCAVSRDGRLFIEDYELLKVLGAGGQGVVFLARRNEPVVIHVAVKVLLDKNTSRGFLARFQQEREMIALMDHPGIARVVDAGLTRGLPFMAIEFVPGETLSAYCKAHRLGIRDRLKLFIRICEAVQHAHTKGIIHRDLKPGNILARSAGNEHVAKIIDFGVAKATADAALRNPVFTATHQGPAPGTVLYMSPEQAGGAPNNLDTRTDIFTLGVILYEMLLGVCPFERKFIESMSDYDRLQWIRERERPRASEKWAGLDPDLAAQAAEERDVSIRELGDILKGDLDWILLKALDLDRDRRYANCSELAADVTRYLQRQPVQARPPSTLYLARKFVTRNRLAVSAAAAVLLAIIAGAGVAGWQWNEAVAQKAGSEGLLDFINDFLTSGTENGSHRIPVAVSTIEAAREEFVDRLGSRPRIMARLSTTFGTAFLSAGQPGRAIELLEPLWQTPDGQRNELIAAPLATAYMRIRRADAALGVLEPIVYGRTRALGSRAAGDQKLADLRNTLAGCLKWLGRFEAAEQEYLRVRAARTKAGQSGVEKLVRVDYDLLLTRKRRFEQQRAVSLEVRETFYDFCLLQMEALIEQARLSLGDTHEQTLACRMEAVNLTERRFGRPTAIAAMESLIPALETELGVRHWRTLEASGQLGRWLLDECRYDHAIRVLDSAYHAGLRDTPGGSGTLIDGLNLARALAESGNPDAGCLMLVNVLVSGSQSGADSGDLRRFSQVAADWTDRWGRPVDSAHWRLAVRSLALTAN